MLQYTYDYACGAECAQEFEGLMPKVMEKLDTVGAGENKPFYTQGAGVEPLEVVDVTGLAEE